MDCFKKGQTINSCKEGHVVRCTKVYLAKILEKAIDDRRLNKEDLPVAIQNKLS